MFSFHSANLNTFAKLLSEMSNVPYTTLNELINGKKKITDCKIKTIESIANALNCSIETLLKLLNGSKFTLLGVRYEKNDKHGLVQRWEE